MEEKNKRIIAKEIVLNLKMIGIGIFIGAVIGFAYGYCVYPPKTTYTPPGKIVINNVEIGKEWPETENGKAVLIPDGVINIGEYWSAYFSNESKYDDKIFPWILRDGNYSFSKVSDVINCINSERIKYYREDLLNFMSWAILASILGLILIRYLCIFIYNSINWVKKYKRNKSEDEIPDKFSEILGAKRNSELALQMVTTKILTSFNESIESVIKEYSEKDTLMQELMCKVSIASNIKAFENSLMLQQMSGLNQTEYKELVNEIAKRVLNKYFK